MENMIFTDAQGGQSNYSSFSPSITSNGRYVVFTSTASNLVPNDSNGVDDIFLKDLKTGAITRVSTDVQGNQGNARSYNPYIAANGRYVVFTSTAFNLVPNDTNNVNDVFIKDLKTGAVTRMSANAVGEQGNGRSGTPTITANGRYVAFDSAASNLAPNDTNNNDVFVYDRKGKP
jgi:Tol biopolymer transport system component